MKILVKHGANINLQDEVLIFFLILFLLQIFKILFLFYYILLNLLFILEWK